MAKYKITQDQDLCIGCKTCVSVCPSNWAMDEEKGKAYPKKSEDDADCNKEAAEMCPVQCITVEETE